MNKQELFKEVQEKLNINEEELNKIYTALETQLKERGKTTEETVLQRMYAYLAPSLRTNAQKFKGIFLGIEDNFLFNKNTDAVKYDAMKKYAENKEEAISLEYVKIAKDEHAKDIIIPLWHTTDGINVQDFKMGKPIIDAYYSANAYLFVEKDKQNYTLKQLNLRGERRDFVNKNIKSLQFKNVEFMAIEKENKPMNDSKYLNMKVIEEKEVNITQLLGKFAKKMCINLNDLSEFYKKNTELFIKTKSGYLSKDPIFVRCAVNRIVISETGDNNIVGVVDINYQKQFSIFLPKNLEVPAQGSSNVIFGGRLRFNENNTDQPFSMNGFMCYVPENVRNLEVPEILKKYLIVEENVTDTIKEQKLLEMKKEVEEDW